MDETRSMEAYGQGGLQSRSDGNILWPEYDRILIMRIRYMGNKHGLAPDVLRLASWTSTEVPLVDLFCGLCSVGEAFARSGRSVWGNDVQNYAALAARCHLTAKTPPLRSPRLASLLLTDYRRNARALKRRFGAALVEEDAVLASCNHARYLRAHDAWRHSANDVPIARELDRLRRHRRGPDRLFTLSFAWGYFGLRQAIAIDSLRHAIDRARERRELNRGQAEWALLALVQSASSCGSTPGHFAQYLNGHTSAGFARIIRQRRRDVWEQFLLAADQQRPFGSRIWRSGNVAMTADALKLWPALDRRGVSKAIVYADPPYSKDHYSRYYHVLETLVLYDYPDAVGVGRYRSDRFFTPFSLKREAGDAFNTLFERIDEREWSLILSYPTNGLLPATEVDERLRERFSSVRLALRRPVAHSTLGGRHGNARSSTEELMWIAS